MVKDKVITVRVEEFDKAQYESAAKRMGMSLTTFVEQSLRVAANKANSAGPKKWKKQRGVPKEYANICAEARKGGAVSYARAADWILEHLGELLRDVETEEEWKDKIRQLKAAACDPFEIVAWFESELPSFIALIPNRRRDQLLNAVCNAINSEGLPYWTDYSLGRQVKETVKLKSKPVGRRSTA